MARTKPKNTPMAGNASKPIGIPDGSPEMSEPEPKPVQYEIDREKNIAHLREVMLGLGLVTEDLFPPHLFPRAKGKTIKVSSCHKEKSGRGPSLAPSRQSARLANNPHADTSESSNRISNSQPPTHTQDVPPNYGSDIGEESDSSSGSFIFFGTFSNDGQLCIKDPAEESSHSQPDPSGSCQDGHWWVSTSTRSSDVGSPGGSGVGRLADGGASPDMQDSDGEGSQEFIQFCNFGDALADPLGNSGWRHGASQLGSIAKVSSILSQVRLRVQQVFSLQPTPAW